MEQPATTRIAGDGVELQLYEWPGRGRPIFLAHATGFHARLWDQVVAHLPGRHCYAIDMRGHGLSGKPEPPYDWRYFARDVAIAARHLNLRGALGVGHSKGGHALVGAAAEAPEAFAALLLIDPVIQSRTEMSAARPDEHFASRRRDRWSSPEEMIERFRNRAPFDAWDAAVLDDYCRYGLLPAPDGDGFVLACPPAVEASIYLASGNRASVYEDIAKVMIPTRILRAREREKGAMFDMSGSPTAPDLASYFALGEDVPLPQYSHFIPMEDPGYIATEIEAMLARLPAFDAAGVPPTR